MKSKEGLYAIIGGIVGAVFTLAVCAVMPIGAQNGDATFGKITCTGLNVVDVNGNDRVRLLGSSVSGAVYMYGLTGTGAITLDTLSGITIEDSRGSVELSTNDKGGVVSISGKNDSDKISERAAMAINYNGGLFRLSGNDNIARALLFAGDQGGELYLWETSKLQHVVTLGVNDNGGVVQVRSTDSERFAQMHINKHGGSVSVFGKGSDSSRAIMTVNEYGNGAVSTWDKNGYRLD